LLEKLARTSHEVLQIRNDRPTYFLTFLQWARDFDCKRDFLIERFGAFNYRRFRLYHWGAAHGFLSRSLDYYCRMIIPLSRRFCDATLVHPTSRRPHCNSDRDRRLRALPRVWDRNSVLTPV
jgi:hypothetical protein